MALNLFAAATDQAKKDVLVEFKAGCLAKEENTKWVRPDTRKGLVQLRQTGEDGLIHFQWRDRTSGSLGLDLTIFPGEAVWKRVKECTTGRVYVLEFAANKKLHFFWLQEPKEDKDEEYFTKMNQYLKEPPPPQEAAGGAGGLDQNQLSQMLAQAGLGGLGGLGGLARAPRRAPAATTSTTSTSSSSPAPSTPSMPATTSTSTTTTTSSSTAAAGPATPAPANDNVRLALQNILSSVLQQPAEEKEPKGPSLNDILATDAVNATQVLNDEEIKRELQQHLPENETVAGTLRSPQFRQAVGAFNAALSQGHISELLAPLGLQPSNLPARSNQEAFLNAVQQSADKDKEKKKTTEEKKDDKDKMDTS